MVARYRVYNTVGCLIEARIEWLGNADHAEQYAADIRAIAQRGAGQRRPVLCADHRRANVYPPEVADVLAVAFRPNNRRFARIAIIASAENATLLLQLQRLTRLAGSEDRKVFLDPGRALAHLEPALTVEERQRVEAFLSEA